MIVKQYIEDGKFVKYFSDEYFRIQKEGTEEIYDDAIELKDTEVEYVETDEKIERPILDDDATITDYEKALREVGVDI